MKRFSRSLGATFLAVIAALALGACGGGGSPAGPSAFPAASSSGISLDGTVLGGASSTGFSAASASAFSSGTITVTVLEDPTLTTTVDATDGSFTLRGLPEGSFTLEFRDDDGVLGVVTFDSVMPNQELVVIVEVTDTGVDVVQETRNGIGHGDVELEGEIEEILVLDPSGDSRFSLDGTIVVVRPGTTAIRQGNTGRQVDYLEAGQKVHVKAVWMEPEGAEQPVLAHEVKIQEEVNETPDDPPGGKVTLCHVPPGNPSKKKTLEVDAADVDGHLGHGDKLGPC